MFLLAMAEAVNNRFSFGEFEINPDRRLLLRAGEAVPIKAKTFDLLLALVENRGKVLSKDELLDRVWENQFVEENNLTVHVAALRKALGESRNENRYIVTVPGKGYRFVGDLNDHDNGEVVVEKRTLERIVVEEQIEDESPAPRRLSASPSVSRRPIYLIGAIVMIALMVGAAFYFTRPSSTVTVESIAVMPFVYEGSNPDNEYLSDGMTESLINSLSQVPGLSVKARSSVFHYKGKEIDSSQIGSELSVHAILLGRIVERGDQLQFSIELVDVSSGNQIWGDQYVRKAHDLAMLQTDVARDVALKLRRKLEGPSTLARGTTKNAEAFELYLKGRYLWNKRNQNDHLKAIDFFQRAIQLDPKFALAYAGLGDVYTVDSFDLGDRAQQTRLGREAAMNALGIEPELAEGHAILAKVEWREKNYELTEQNFRRAIELNPSYASAHQWYGEFLAHIARFDEAIASIERALALDPLSLIINSDAANIYLVARQYDRAIAQADRTHQLDPTWRIAFVWRISANEYKGNFAEAMRDLERAIEISRSTPEEKEKRRRDVERMRKAHEQDGAAGYWNANLEIERSRDKPDDYFLAIIYANLGKKDEALTSLEQEFKEGNNDPLFFAVEPAFEVLHSEPRFQDLVKRKNLPRS